jgi:hypothetical protein
MSRFQALTNSILDQELESLRQSLGLEPSQRAELLREIAALAAWVVRQAALGRAVEARRGQEVERLAHPAVERLLQRRSEPAPERWILSEEEAERFAAALDRPFAPTPELKAALRRLADPDRSPPKLTRRKAV